jgi:hypothetical protein
MWFLCECLRFALPAALKRKRFLAPEWDFIFGMADPELKRGAYVPQACLAGKSRVTAAGAVTGDEGLG